MSCFGVNSARGVTRILLIASVIACCVPAVRAEILFEDVFSAYPATADDVDRTVWTTVEGDEAIFGRTAIRNPYIPEWMAEGLPTKIAIAPSTLDASRVARLRLDTYNPTEDAAVHYSFWGSEIDTGVRTISGGQFQNLYTTFSLADHPGGIYYEARVRTPDNLPEGAVTSLFAYGLYPDNTRDEIDIEVLTNQDSNQVHLNYFTQEGFESAGRLQQTVTVPGLDTAEFNTFKIVSMQERIEWYINDALIYSVDAGPGISLPVGPMGMRLNIWVPGESWNTAYNPSFTPANQLDRNQEYFYEVQWARVGVVPEPVSCVLFLLGGGALAVNRGKKFFG